MNVSTIDYAAETAPADFTTSLKRTGFAVLTNHPIDYTLIQAVYTEWSLFFQSNQKNDYLFDLEKQDGYFPFGSENAKGSSIKDLKEFYHIYPWGRYPQQLSDNTWKLYRRLCQIAEELLDWVELNTPVEIAESFSMALSEMVQDSPRNLLRIIHYPSLSGDEEKGAVRAAPHEDINLLTILVAGTEPGLQVQDVNGNWHDVSCDPGTLAINTGDMLQMASGGFYPSTTHQVINPISSQKNSARFSMPLFLHPNDGVRLNKNYTAGSYLDERLKEIGLKS